MAVNNIFASPTCTGEPSGSRRVALNWVNFRHIGFNGRRTGDRVNSYVDSYEARYLLAVMITMCCCAVDAFLTLLLLDRGAVEVNLLMDSLILKDMQLFVNLKLALTGLCLVLLVVHKNFIIFRALKVSHLLYAFTFLYMMLNYYQLGMLASVR